MMPASLSRSSRANLSLALACCLALSASCSDDDPPKTGGSAGSSGSAGKGGASGASSGGTSAGKSGSAGTSAGGSMQTGGDSQGGQAGETNDGGMGASAGAGGEGVDPGPVGPFTAYPPVGYPTENPHSDPKAMLGKILFWDQQVGGDGTVACGSCHRTDTGGGSDPRAVGPQSRHPGADGALGTPDDIRGSMGVVRCTPGGNQGPFAVTYTGIAPYAMNPQVTGRRAPTYLDAMFSSELFWDGRARTSFIDPDIVTPTLAIIVGGALESQAVGPPLSPVEMACENRTWPDVHQRLTDVTPLALAHDIPADMQAAITAAAGQYESLFEAAFGTPEINTRRFAFAIATHERRLTSNQTPWDLYNAGDRGALTAAQERGLRLFNSKAECATCHIPPLFTDRAFHNLGFVDSGCANCDVGRQAHDSAAPRGAVKTPTLRNVGLREAQGLFHFGFDPASVGVDGHADLEKVMAAYNNPPAKEPEDEAAIKALNLTPAEIADIIDFMRNGLTDPRVEAAAAPFDRPLLSDEP